MLRGFLVLYRFGGVNFTERRYATDRRNAVYWAGQAVRMRRAQVPEETTDLVWVKQVGSDRASGDDITEVMAQAIEEENRDDKERKGLPSPEDFDEDYANKVLHIPVTA